MSFGSNVLFYRKKFGITQEALAEKLEVTRQTVSRWETDSAFPDMDKLLILCDLFGCNMEVLVRGNAEAENAQRHEANLEAYNKHMNVYTAQITSGVTLILAGVTAMLFLSAAGTREVVGLVTFFVCITLAVFIFVAGGVAHGNFMRENPRVEKYSADKVSAFRLQIALVYRGRDGIDSYRRHRGGGYDLRRGIRARRLYFGRLGRLCRRHTSDGGDDSVRALCLCRHAVGQIRREKL